MRDGLHKVQFHTPTGAGAGVVVVTGNTMRGGDSSIYYLGTYSESGNQLSARVRTARHSPALPSVFGIDAVDITLQGTVTGDSAQLTGSARQAPGMSFSATLTRLAD